MSKGFQIGDWVTNPEWGESPPFQLEEGHYKGISSRSNIWFNGLKAYIPIIGSWWWYENSIVQIVKFPPNDTLYGVLNPYTKKKFCLHKSHIKTPFIGVAPYWSE